MTGDPPMRFLIRRGVAAALTFTLSALGSLAASATSPAPWAHEASDLHPDPAIVFGALPNGLRYAVRSNPEPASRVFLILRVQAGSLYERDDQRGFAHFVEHMAFNGTQRYPRTTLVETMQRAGYDLGAHLSAFTGYTSTFYQLDVPRNDDASLDLAFTVLGEFAQHVTFDAKEVKKERGVIESERRTYVTARKDYSQELDAFLYRDSRFAQRAILGDPAQLQRAKPEDLRAFYRTWYRPSRMTVIAVGDLPAERLVAFITRHFGGLVEPATPPPPEPDLGRFTPTDGIEARYIGTEQAGGITNLLYSVRPSGAPGDTAASRRAKVAAAACDWMLHERLQAVMREAPVDFGQAQAGSFELFQAADVNFLRLDTQSGVWRRGIVTLDTELRRALEYGFSADEVEAQRSRFETHYVEAIRRAAKMASADYARYLLQSIELGYVPTSPEDTWAAVQDSVRQLTPDTCLAALRRIWPGDARRFVVLGTQPRLTTGEEIAAAVGEGRRLTTLDDKPLVTTKTLAYTFAAAPPEPVHREHRADIDVHLVTFPNGVRLSLKRTDYEPNQVLTSVRLGYGLATEPREKSGIATAAATALLAGGLGRHDEAALNRILAAESLHLQFSAAEDAYVFSGTSSRSSLGLLLRLNTAYIRDPAYRVAPMFTAMSQLQGYYTSLANSPENFTASFMPRSLHGGDHRYGLPLPNEVFRHTPEALRAWLEPILDHGPLDVSIIGDIDIEETIAEVGRTFGTLGTRETRAPLADTLRPRVRPLRAEETARLAGGLHKASVTVAWPFELQRVVEDPRRMRMLSLLVTLRLRQRLREELGATYAPASDLWQSTAWPRQGYLYATALVEPAKAPKVARIIREIASDLSTRGATADEFRQVHEPKVADLATELRNNSYWLYYVLPHISDTAWAAQLPLTRTADYRSITVDELNAFARHHLRPAEASTLIVTSD